MEETKAGISRRTALKGIGVGTALAWTAPMVLSIETPAFAQSEVCTNCDATCPRSGNQCAPGHFCLIHVGTNSCVCVFANYCTEAAQMNGADILCSSDADCPSGYVCATTCCGQGSNKSQNLCVLPSDPPSNQTTGWDVAGYYRCAQNSDCTAVGMTTCTSTANGMVLPYTVCQ